MSVRLLSSVEGFANLVDIITIYLYYVPSPRLILGGGVLAHDHSALCRELDVVGVVEHDEVVEAEVAGDASDTLTYFLLNATIRDVSINLVLHDRLAKSCLEELLCHGSTGGDSVSLS